MMSAHMMNNSRPELNIEHQVRVITLILYSTLQSCLLGNMSRTRAVLLQVGKTVGCGPTLIDRHHRGIVGLDFCPIY